MVEQTFSERYGFAPNSPEITIRYDAPADLRGMVTEFAYESGLRCERIKTIVCREIGVPPDPSLSSDDCDWEVRRILNGCEWYEVYDVIEVLLSELRRVEPWVDNGTGEDRFSSRLNRFFIKNGIGWQLVGGRLEVRGTEGFEAAVHTASSELKKAGMSTAAQEIHEALHCLSRRPNPDRTGAIQHAMAAAECVAREFADKPKGTLGDIIKRNPGLFPSPLGEGVNKLWGYASEQGRHLREGREPGYEEAELSVTVAAGVITYFIKKHKVESQVDE